MRILRRLNPIIKDINRYFGFLYDKGFHIRNTNIEFMASRNWEVTFESSQCLIKIFSDQYEVFIAFAPTNYQIDNRLGIKSMVYYLSKRQIFINKFDGDFRNRKAQLEWLADILKEYINQIIPYFEIGKYEKYHDELLAAQKDYSNIYIKKYIPGISTF